MLIPVSYTHLQVIAFIRKQEQDILRPACAAISTTEARIERAPTIRKRRNVAAQKAVFLASVKPDPDAIAAVAQIDLLTMRRDCQIGSHLQIEGSKFISQTPEACPYFSKYSNAQERNSFFETSLDFASLSSVAKVF